MISNGTSGATQKIPKQADHSGCHNAGSSNEDEMDVIPSTSSVPLDPLRPWLHDFSIYIDTRESDLPKGMGSIQWWGVSTKYLFNLWSPF